MGPEQTRQDDRQHDAAAPKTCCSAGLGLTGAKGCVQKALPVVFFALLAAHLAFNVDPRILYHADEASPSGQVVPLFPTYFQGMAFFKPFLSVPGGPAEYFAANVSQYFSARRIAVAILLAIAVAALVVTDSLIGRMGGKKGRVLRFVPPLLLVVIWNRYTFVLADQVALLAALLAAYLYFQLPAKAALRAAVIIAMVAALYYVAGGACLLLAAVCGVHELLAGRRLTGGAYLVVGALTPAVMGMGVFGLDASEAYGRLTGLAGGGQVAVVAWAGLYGFFIILAGVLSWRGRSAESTCEAGGRLEQLLDRLGTGRLRLFAPPAAGLILAAVVAMGTVDRDLRTYRKMCYYFQTESWGALILAAREFPPQKYTGHTCRMLNRALFETGRLGGEMFLYPQPLLGLGGPLLLGPELDQPHKVDTLLQLGAAETAERMAEESLATWGDRPLVLRLLVKIAIVKGDLQAAEGYLQTLSKDIVHGRYAKGHLAKLKGGETFNSDPEIIRLRANMLSGDKLDPSVEATQATLEELVYKNRDNQMAFEYLLAHYLLTLQLSDFAALIPDMDRFKYEYMPPHHAEALTLYFNRTGEGVVLEDLKEDPGTRQRCQRFLALAAEYENDDRGLAMMVAQEMPHSYFDYYFKTAVATGLVP